MALWTVSTGARWTGYTPNRYGLIMAVCVNPMAGSEREIPPLLHSISGEPTMASSKSCSTTNAGMALQTILIETKPTGMKYTHSRIQRGANLGRGMCQSDCPTAALWPA